MKVAIVGLGSMGKRRLRLIKEHLSNIEVFGVDTQLTRRSEVTETFQIECYESLAALSLQRKISAIFVCTSPLSHEAIIREAINYNYHVFTEINLLNNYYQEVCKLADQKNVKLYISSTFLKRREIKYISDRIKEDKNINYNYHVGQYLPDWHPWENYKDFFVSDIRTNGCREIMAIEFPWLIKTFGDVASVSVQKRKISQLAIDYPDSYSLLFKHSNGIIGTVNVDIVSRVAKRSLTVVGEQTQLEWEGNPFSLTQWDNETKEMSAINLYIKVEKDDSYSHTIIEDAYLDEIKEFFAYLEQNQKPEYTFEQDYRVIEIINEIEGEND